MEIAFHGAAGGVTGSCHPLTIGGKSILVDCGLFQGEDEERAARNGTFGFDPKTVDYVLLTHAHLDHCGRLPLLVKEGFRGEIISTSATRDLVRLVLLDAAGLQAEEAKRESRRKARHGEEESAPAYTELDVFDTMDRFTRIAAYGKPFTLCDGVRVTFGDAGHILGSAWVLIEAQEQAKRTRLVFSGDLGGRDHPVLNMPSPAPVADVVIMESTYANRLHKPLDSSIAELRDAIGDTLQRGGNVVIPTFALERSQEILYYLRDLVERGELPHHLTVFLDSPMAISATRIFERHPQSLSPLMRDLFARGVDPFHLPGLHFTRETSDSMAINQITGGAVILAGSGMATGGRILHHLRHNLWRRDSSVVFVGYAAAGTLARAIIDGARQVRIFGEEVRVAAHIYTIGGFSAHADRDDLLAWLASAGTPRHTFLVHGEDAQREVLAATLRERGLRVDLPALHSHYTL